jgi:hypothetical protein
LKEAGSVLAPLMVSVTAVPSTVTVKVPPVFVAGRP